MPLSVSGNASTGGPLSGAALLNAYSATSDPAKAIADAAVAGQLDEKRLAAVISEAAQRQLVRQLHTRVTRPQRANVR